MSELWQGLFLGSTLVGLILVLLGAKNKPQAKFFGKVCLLAQLVALGSVLLLESTSLGIRLFSLCLTGLISLCALRIIAWKQADELVIKQTARDSGQLAVLLLVWWYFTIPGNFLDIDLIPWIAWFGLLLQSILFVKLFATLKIRVLRQPNDNSEQPTVTIAIPARNEDATLERTLQACLDSTYPKLEVLVLDDCSHDKTSQIIKSFAHRGVRFVGGVEPPEGWNGKTFAYQQLLKASSGKLILFCGVDVSLGPESVGKLVQLYQQRSLKMLSVLPYYQPVDQKLELLETAQQANRYFWQFGVSELFSGSAPSVGACWLVDKKALESLGGFEAVKQMIEPNRFFAKAFHKNYHFFTARELGANIVSHKLGEQQFAHMIRVAYPHLLRSPLWTLLAVISLILFGFVPIIGAGLLALGSVGLVQWLFLVSLALILASYGLLFEYLSPRYLWTLPLVVTFNVLQLAVSLVWSMVKYEFYEVKWKGRMVCLPVLPLQFQKLEKD